MAKSNEPRKGTKAWLEQRWAESMKMNSYLVSRSNLSGALGKSFSGERDTYKSFGYPNKVTFDQLLNFYEREGIATSVVDIISEKTWSKHPVLLEGENAALDEDDDPGPLQKSFSQLAEDLDLWPAFVDADKSCGLSRFALIFLGLPGKADTPVESKKTKLAYVTVHDEGNAEIDPASIVKDPEKQRFGLPDRYNIVIDETKQQKIPVHYTRVVAIHEGRSRRDYPRIYGTARLEKIANRLYDLEKVVGGGSEAFWLLIYRGLALSAKEGMSLPDPGSTEYKALQDEIEEYMHGLRRYMRLVGMDVEDLGGEPVDSSGQFDVIMTYIAGSERIPKRILMGSERGELASSQDVANLADHIAGRQTDFAEPRMLRPFIDRMGELGVLKVPDKYTVHWPSLFQLTDLEKAALANSVANALTTASGGAPETVMPPEEFARRYLEYVASKEDQVKLDDLKDEADEQNEDDILEKLLTEDEEIDEKPDEEEDEE